jgi:hypothetical protein
MNEYFIFQLNVIKSEWEILYSEEVLLKEDKRVEIKA